MTVTVNGQRRTVHDGHTVSDIVAELAPAPSGVAVAVNGEVVPRGAWDFTALREGDRVEVLTAVQGG